MPIVFPSPIRSAGNRIYLLFRFAGRSAESLIPLGINLIVQDLRQDRGGHTLSHAFSFELSGERGRRISSSPVGEGRKWIWSRFSPTPAWVIFPKNILLSLYRTLAGIAEEIFVLRKIHASGFS